MQEQRDISSEEKQSGWEQEGKMSEQQPAREAEGTKPKKKPLVIVGIVIGVLLALAIGTGAIYARNTPERRLERQLELGEKYLEEMDYEQAVAAYRAALEIDPRCTEAYLGGIRACDGKKARRAGFCGRAGFPSRTPRWGVLAIAGHLTCVASCLSTTRITSTAATAVRMISGIM